MVLAGTALNASLVGAKTVNVPRRLERVGQAGLRDQRVQVLSSGWRAIVSATDTGVATGRSHTRQAGRRWREQKNAAIAHGVPPVGVAAQLRKRRMTNS